MAKIAFVADVHVGNHKRHGGPVRAGLNRRCELILAALRAAYQAASDADAFVVAGDLFDSSDVSPQVVKATMDCFAGGGPHVYLLMGNHDQHSDEEGDNALTPLRHLRDKNNGSRKVTVVEEPLLEDVDGILLALVPFAPKISGAPLLRAGMKEIDQQRPGKDSNSPLVLTFHLGVADDRTAPWLKGATDSITTTDLEKILVQHGVDVAVAGNWHEPQGWTMRGFNNDSLHEVRQCGALVPTGWDNPGPDYGRVVFVSSVLNADGLDVSEQVIPGPRFLALKDGEVQAALSLFGDGGNQFFLKITCTDSAAVAAAETQLALLKEQDPRILGYEFEVDDGGSTAARVAEAAQAAASSDTLDEAVSGFVGAMPVLDGVDRDVVHARLRSYLKR